MRAPVRLAASVLFVLAGVTCTDGPTSPRNAKGGSTVVSIAPQFSVESQAAFQSLAQFGLNVDNVHIHIDHPPVTAYDTVVAYPVGADSLIIALEITLNGPVEQLTALIELRKGTQVLFSGTQTFTARVGRTPSAPPPPIPVTYVGPGAAARHLSIAPRDTAILVGGGATYRYTATDASGGTVPGVDMAWSVSDPTLGAINAFGGFVPSGKQGRAFIAGVTPNGLRDSTTITVTAPPTKLALISGGGQTGSVGSALAQPLVVQVQTADGTAVPGVAVSFAATAGGGATGTPSTLSDANGRAQTSMTLGHTAGTQTFSASSAGLSGATASETATAGAAALLAKNSGDAQADTIGKPLAQPLVAKVTDSFGNPVSAATVNWARVAGAGTVAAATSASDAGGLAGMGYTLGTVARTDSISATISGLPSSTVIFTARSIPRGASNVVKVSGDGQTASAGTVLPAPLVARVTDNLGNAVAGAAVAWSAVGGGSVNPPTATSDSVGTVAASVTLGGVAGVNQVTATIGGGVSATFTETGTVGAPANLVKVAGDAQTGTASTALPVKPAVRLTDGHGNPVPNVPVTFSVTSGGGSVTGAAPNTDANGVATVGSWTLGASGAQTLKAVAGALNVTFTATFGVAAPATNIAAFSPLAIVDTAGRALPAAKLPTVIVTDGSGAPVAGVAVSYTAFKGTVSGTTPPTSAAGKTTLAGFTVFGDSTVIDTVFATAAGLTGSPVKFTVTAHPNTAAKLKFLVQPTSGVSGSLISPLVRVAVTDSFGNIRGALADSQRIALSALHGPPGGHVIGLTGFSADTVRAVQGTATFSVTGDIAGTYKMVAASGVLSVDSSGTYNITPGPAKHVVVNLGNSQSAQPNDSVAVRPTVLVSDAAGNAIAGATATWKIDATTNGSFNVAPSPGPPVTTTTSVADGTGHANVKWFLGASGPQSMSAYVAGASGVGDTAYFGATLAAAPAAMAITAGLHPSYQSGGPLPLVVQITDANGVAVPVPGVQVEVGLLFPSLGGQDCAAPRRPRRAVLPLAVRGASAPIATNRSCSRPPGVIANRGGSPLRALSAPSAGGRGGSGAGSPNARLVAVDFSGTFPVPPMATLIGDSVLITDATGKVTFSNLFVAGDVTIPFTIEVFDVTGSLTGVVDPTSRTLTPGPAFDIGASTSGVHQMAGRLAAAPPSVFVFDSVGNPVPGTSVTFAVTGGGGSISVPVVPTGAGGLASPQWTLGAASGSNTATATATVHGAPKAVPISAIGHQAARLVVSNDSLLQSFVASGGALAPQPLVEVRDSSGTFSLNDAGVPVAAGVVLIPPTQSGPVPTFGGTSPVLTDANGLATFAGLTLTGLGDTVGVVFSGGGLASVTTRAIAISSVGPPVGIIAPAGIDFFDLLGTASRPLAVKVVDNVGNAVPGTTVNYAASGPNCRAVSGSGTTDTGGLFSRSFTLPSAIGSCLVQFSIPAGASIAVHDAVAPTGYRVWFGAGANASWTTTANWLGGVVPAPGDSVFIPAATTGATPAQIPALVDSVQVGTLVVESTGDLQLQGHGVYVRGNLIASGWSSHTGSQAGSVLMFGTGTVRADVPARLLMGDSSSVCVGPSAGISTQAIGQVTADSIIVNCPFDVNGQFVQSNGKFVVKYRGTLTMADPAGFVVAGGDFVYRSSVASGTMNAGTLQTDANFVQDTVLGGAKNNFVATGAHLLNLRDDGLAAHSISFTAAASQISNLNIQSGFPAAPNRSFVLNGAASTYHVTGTLTADNGAKVFIPSGVTVTTGGVVTQGAPAGTINVSGVLTAPSCTGQSAGVTGTGTRPPSCPP